MKNVIVIAGPTGSGKDSIIRELIKRYGNVEFAVNATSRAPRPGEVDGQNYHFMTNDKFKEEMAAGNIPEHYYREVTDTYYGMYKPDLDARLARGRIVAFQIQIVGAKYLKENYGAITFFIMPSDMEEFTNRVRSRAAVSEDELKERMQHAKREIEVDAPWYDYRIKNEEGKLLEAVDNIVAILTQEGFKLEPA